MASSIYASRREELMRAMAPDAVALVVSPPEVTRSWDTHYAYRQSSDLLYLTGFAEPESALVLVPGAEKERVILFVRERNKEREQWEGRRAGPEGAVRDHGVDAAYTFDKLEGKLAELVAHKRDLYYSLGTNPDMDARLGRILARMRLGERRVGPPPDRIVDPRTVLHEMRLKKSAEELQLIREACDISAEAHVEAMRAARAGAHEYELQAVIEYTFRRRGAAAPGYNTIVGAGDNATILHYVENTDRLEKGQLVLIDAGAEYRGYTADITRTFPVDGKFTPAQRDVYQVVLAAQKQAITATRPGATIDGIHEGVVRALTQGMIDLGLLEGSVDARIEDKSYMRFYMHRTSHWLGMDVHDVGAYTRDRKPRPLEPGMLITIEPGLYICGDDDKAPAKLRGIGVRIEDDVLITDGAAEVLTSRAPKELSDVEAACSS